MSLSSIESINIIGFGRMGKSMLSGWLNNQLSKEVVKIVDPFLDKKDPFLINNNLNLYDMDKIRLDDGIALIAVKPQVAGDLFDKLKEMISENTIIISIIAGYSVADMREHLGPKPTIIRTMPNTPAAIGKGITALFSENQLSQDLISKVESLFGSMGKFFWVENETDMHAITAISGSGPAYYYLFTEYLSDIAVKYGLKKELADILSTQTYIGSSVLMENSPNIGVVEHRENTTPIFGEFSIKTDEPIYV
jgi:pyrroline-5-carboxylate reductase